MKISSFGRFVFLFSMAILGIGCSLDYDQSVYVEDHIPELQFVQADFTRYENYQRKFRLTAERLEQYKNTAAAYAMSAKFYTWEEENLDTEGSCYYLSINTKDQIFTLFKDIVINNYGQDLELTAQNLKWNGNTEQLTASTSETVRIRHQGLSLEGTGFSASGITRSYSYEYDVEGFYDSDFENPKITEEEAQ